MAVNSIPPEPFDLSTQEMASAIARFRRRIAELENFEPSSVKNRSDPRIDALEVSIDESLREAFGHDTSQYRLYSGARSLDTAGINMAHATPLPQVIAGLTRGKERALALLNQATRFFEEKLTDLGEQPSQSSPEAKAPRAYEGMDLHPMIARAASDLYRNGHYANAIEDAVKALNNLVRLASGVEGDGTPLMETVFSPKKPILRFNVEKTNRITTSKRAS
jgi:Protein of unknown function (Hypoth_ymh)